MFAKLSTLSLFQKNIMKLTKINATPFLFIALCGLFLPQCSQPAAEKTTAETPAPTLTKQLNQTNPKMLVHHVYFYMAPDASEADKAALRAGLESLTQIAVLQHWHLGTPAPTDRDVIDRGYTYSWLTIFANGEDEAIYQNHPVHVAFVKNCQHLWSKVIVYDAI
jgi:hypothetical protein